MKRVSELSLIVLMALVALYGCRSAGKSSQKPDPSAAAAIQVEDIPGNLTRISFDNCKMNFVTKDRPSPSDSNILLCVAAAYTKDTSSVFSENRVGGRHLVKGTLYDGYSDPDIDGSFACFNGQYYFSEGYDEMLAMNAQQQKGVFFQQNLLIINGERSATPYLDDRIEYFRCIGEYKGNIYIFQSGQPQRFGDFIKALMDYGVVSAIHLDMAGWKYSWYRDSTGQVKSFFPEGPNTEYQISWLTFTEK